MAMNHLIESKQINVNKLGDLIDYPSSSTNSIFSKVHIHVYHGQEIFSKFFFRDGKYDNITLPNGDRNLINFYCLNIALESKRKNSSEMHNMLQDVIKVKI